MVNYEKVLAVVAHPDDELSCAGTLARFVDNGSHVSILSVHLPDLSRDGRQMGFKSKRLDEFEAAADALEIENVESLDIDEEHFVWSQHYVRILDKHVQPYRPDLVITQRINDTQQTHSHLSRVIGTVARKNRFSLWEMDQPIPGGWESQASRVNCFVNITEYVDPKLSAIRAYSSQGFRYPGLEDALMARDRYYGWLMNSEDITTKYAEGFNIRKQTWN